MSVASFIPQIWNADLLMQFRETAVAANLVNREYEGDATKGNTVKVSSAGAVSVFDYSIGEGNGGTAGAPLPRTTAPEAVSTITQDLLIDQEKNFDFYVDDIDRAQAAGSMDVYTTDAGRGLAEDADKFILATGVTGAGSSLSGDGATTPAAVTTGDGAWNVVRNIRKILNQGNVPLSDRILVVDSEFEGLLVGADSKITDIDRTNMPTAVRDGFVTRLLGFDVYVSDNLPGANGVGQALGYYRPALAYVSQIEETEAMRANERIADRLRGLHVYGAKVTRPLGVVAWDNL